MAKLSETYGVGNTENITPEQLLRLMQDMYTDLAIAINRKPDVIQRETDGLTTDTFLSNGDININLSTDKVEMVTNHPTGTTVTWTQLS